jgi:isoamylase
MGDADWQKPFVRSWMVMLGGDSIETPDEQGERILGDSLLVLFNAHHESMTFTLPELGEDEHWMLQLDTSEDARPQEPQLEPEYELPGRALAIFRQLLKK